MGCFERGHAAYRGQAGFFGEIREFFDVVALFGSRMGFPACSFRIVIPAVDEMLFAAAILAVHNPARAGFAKGEAGAVYALRNIDVVAANRGMVVIDLGVRRKRYGWIIVGAIANINAAAKAVQQIICHVVPHNFQDRAVLHRQGSLADIQAGILIVLDGKFAGPIDRKRIVVVQAHGRIAGERATRIPRQRNGGVVLNRHIPVHGHADKSIAVCRDRRGIHHQIFCGQAMRAVIAEIDDRILDVVIRAIGTVANAVDDLDIAAVDFDIPGPGNAAPVLVGNIRGMQDIQVAFVSTPFDCIFREICNLQPRMVQRNGSHAAAIIINGVQAVGRTRAVHIDLGIFKGEVRIPINIEKAQVRGVFRVLNFDGIVEMGGHVLKRQAAALAEAIAHIGRGHRVALPVDGDGLVQRFADRRVIQQQDGVAVRGRCNGVVQRCIRLVPDLRHIVPCCKCGCRQERQQHTQRYQSTKQTHFHTLFHDFLLPLLKIFDEKISPIRAFWVFHLSATKAAFPCHDSCPIASFA